ncbi:MAG: alanine--tRNA ligase [Patescibacteria group bacterium]|jgi:alanyl-tRNA synthetase
MTSSELRQKFLDYFKEKGHIVIPSASLVPENDPSVLFTTAGMHPLVPYLLGEKHPLGKRLTDVQKCLRTDDIDEVGDTQHLTFFEMLGYWSLGDYFKKESIKYTFGFYSDVLGFKKDDISVSVFAGDDDALFDEESYLTWKDEIGIPEERIYKYPKEENWWGPVSETGPCGPCTEMFIDTGIDPCGDNCGPSCKCDKFVEIGNNVFMEYFKTAEGKFEKLEQKNVDVGLGLERLAMFSQNKKSVFEIDIFEPIIKKIEEISGKKHEDNQKEFRIIADHIRAAVFAISDGAVPSNKGAGYITRRLIRRALAYFYLLTGKIDNTLEKLYGSIRSIYEVEYPTITDKNVLKELTSEEIKFGSILVSGIDLIAKNMDSDRFFDLYQSHGLYPEITLELMENKGFFSEDKEKEKRWYLNEFDVRYKKHQELSRTASAGMFKGGLADAGGQATKYHTATHLLLAALKKLIDPNIIQRGSNITAERLRFDFNYPEKLTPEQIRQIEDLVNEQIQNDLPVVMEEMTLDEAKKSGAKGIFESKYGERVKVYTIGDPAEPFSREICGGPHVAHLSELGHFKVQKEESSSAGVRRIKAMLE